jgi:hypothetical protein
VNSTTPTLKQRAHHGFKEYLVISCYLCVAFSLFSVNKSIILTEHHIATASRGFALLNGLESSHRR